MTHLTLLAVTPASVAWSPSVAAVMIICNIVAIAIGKATIAKQNEGPGLPAPAMFGGMSLGALLGTASLGHIIGAGMILGMASAGIL